MLIRQIEYFAAVVEYQSFTEAAEQCYVSQSAISQQMQALEKELGVKLIQREKRRIRLTPAGEFFYHTGKEILDEIETLRRETIRIGQDEELLLRIGYPKSYSGSGLQRAVAEFSRTYPDVYLDVRNGTHDELHEALRLGEADLIFCDLRQACPAGCTVRRFPSSPCYVQLSVQNRLSRRPHITLDDLKRTPCILISSDQQQNAEQEYFKQALGFHMGFLFAENPEEARLMVAGNRGFLLTVKPEMPLSPDTSFRFLPLFCGTEPLMRNFGIIWRKDRAGYYMEEFADILEGHLRGFRKNFSTGQIDCSDQSSSA